MKEQQEQGELQFDSEESDARQVEVEQEARLYGWLPKEEFRGDEAEWRDAATFVQRGKEINPILRKNNERLLKELSGTKSELEDLKLTVKEFGEMYAKLSETAYKRAIDEVKGQLKNARREGDYDLADQLEEQMETLKEESKAVKIPGEKKPTSAPDPVEGQRILGEWTRENPWYNESTNPDLFYAAEGLAMRLSRERPDLVGKREFLDEVTERMKRTYPDKFSNPRKKQGSPVSGSGESRAAPRSSGKQSYADLPPEAKAACDRFVKSIPGYTKEKYVQDYFEGN